MKRFMIVGAFALLAGEQALAADLPPPAPMPRAPAVYVPAPIPVYNWTGFYIGGNLGVGWQQGNLGDTLGNTFGTDNSIRGLGWRPGWRQLRICQRRRGRCRSYVRLAVSTTITPSHTTLVDPADSRHAAAVTVNNQWLTTATGKLGYAWDRVMVYAKGGGAWVGSSNPTIALVAWQ